MRVYYRGYVINEVHPQQECMVEGRRPGRETVAFENDFRKAMRWVDRDVIRQRVIEAGWLTARPVAV